MDEFANDPVDDPADEFRSRRSLVLQRRAAHPTPADEGELAGEAASDPSLPTTGWRGRRQPPNLVQWRGGRGGRWEKGQKGGNRVSSSGRGEGSIEEVRWVRRGWKEARGEHDGAGNADVHRASHGEEGKEGCRERQNLGLRNGEEWGSSGRRVEAVKRKVVA